MCASFLRLYSRTRAGVLLMWLLVLCEFAGVCIRTPNPSFPAGVMLNVTAVKGDNVEFRCAVEDIGNYMVAFLKADDPPRLITYDQTVFRQPDKYELKKVPDEDVWLLTVRNVQESDAGGYTCQLNTMPVTGKTAHLHLKIPPLVSRSSTPSAVEVREGHNVSLSCEASGNPPPRITWRRQDRQVIRFNGANGFGASVYNGSELFLMRVNRKHMSEYICMAENGIPPDETWTVKLHVTFEPVVTPQSTVVEAHQGSTVRLVCNVEAWPRPMVTWLFNDLEVYDPTRYHTETAVAERYKSVHVLEIRSVQKNTFGHYRCIASNEYGKNFSDIRLVEAPRLETNSIVLTEGSGGSPPAASPADDPDAEGPSVEPSDNPDDERADGQPVDYEAVDAYLERRSRTQQEEDELRDVKIEDPAVLDAGSTEEQSEESNGAKRHSRWFAWTLILLLVHFLCF
ncbi:hypothetical protein M3Y99_01101800 [Aphelenchoides fujianensis]|nr:hypothetical protein M3Y99_01101800 [Aphelenchoides fujianensis]